MRNDTLFRSGRGTLQKRILISEFILSPSPLHVNVQDVHDASELNDRRKVEGQHVVSYRE
jgi:hypothetical protein